MGGLDDWALKKYTALNFVLAALHYTVSALVISSDGDEQFKVPLVYSYNNWYPAADGTANCGAGCFITEERITITEDLNIVMMIAFFGFIREPTTQSSSSGDCLASSAAGLTATL